MFGGLLTALLVIAPLAAQDRPADEKGSDRVKQFEAVQKDYVKAVPGVQKKLEEARTPEEQKAIFAKLNKEFAPRIVKLVEADPKDKLSFNMLVWALRALPNTDARVFDLLGEHWAKDAKMKLLCQFFASQPPEGAGKFFEKVLANNSDKDTKGLACFALAKLHADKADKGDKKALGEAEKFYERVGKEFTEVELAKGITLGDMAKGGLFEIRHLQIGMKVPNIESEDLEGKKVQLKDYKGKVVVLDIWATWCGPCKAMIPHERELVKKLKDKPFTFISISADEKKDTLTEFLKDNPMPWTHWWNGQTGGILKEWNIQHFPTIYVVDAKGIIRYKEIRGKELEEAVEKLLAEVKQ
jgi:thiol-disulfide isomerase/thioredoxin